MVHVKYSINFQQMDGQDECEELVGNSPKMPDAFHIIRRGGPSDVPVLITGESGTGKNWWRGRFTVRARERTSPLLRSTAVRFQRRCLRANYSDMREGPLPERRSNVRAKKFSLWTAYLSEELIVIFGKACSK